MKVKKDVHGDGYVKILEPIPPAQDIYGYRLMQKDLYAADYGAHGVHSSKTHKQYGRYIYQHTEDIDDPKGGHTKLYEGE
jgi:hypothetical protein